MAIHTDPRMYSGGAVVFNNQPSVNAYANLLARQQAKMDAMDNYERSRINSVNEAGMRDNERKIFDDQLADLRSHYNNNKQKISKGNSKEAFDYEKKFRGVRDLIATSKDRAARHDAALKYYNERLKVDGRVPDDFMKELHENDLPIGTKVVDEATGEMRETKPFDITKWASEAKPFNAATYLKRFTGVKRTPSSPRYEKIEGQPLKQNEVIEETFDAGGKQSIAAIASDMYDNSHSFSNQVSTEIKDPTRRKQLADVFKAEYGVEPTMPSDYGIAYTMELLQPKIVKSKAIDNKEAIMKEQQANRKEIQSIGQENKQANIKLASSLGLGSWKSKYEFDKAATEAGVDKNKVTVDGLIEGSKQPDGTLKLDPSLLGLPDYAQNLRLNPNGKDISYDVTYEGGKKETKSITRESGNKFMANKLDLRVVPVPQKQPTNAKYSIKGKTYTEAELKKLGYTSEQIAPYKQK